MLNLQEATVRALNADFVKTLTLYEVYFMPPTFSSSSSYTQGDYVLYLDVVYKAKIDNAAPSEAPTNGTYWEVPSDYPLRFTSWDEDVLWDGNTYSAWAIKHSDITQKADGSINDVAISIGNIDEDRLIQQILETYEVIGQTAKIIQFLLNVDTNSIIDDPITASFKIKGAKARKGQVDFTLSMGFDYLLTTVPKRIMKQSFCDWKFKDTYCKYAGADTECEKTFDDCREKGNAINFGGFPGIMNQRFYF